MRVLFDNVKPLGPEKERVAAEDALELRGGRVSVGHRVRVDLVDHLLDLRV